MAQKIVQKADNFFVFTPIDLKIYTKQVYRSTCTIPASTFWTIKSKPLRDMRHMSTFWNHNKEYFAYKKWTYQRTFILTPYRLKGRNFSVKSISQFLAKFTKLNSFFDPVDSRKLMPVKYFKIGESGKLIPLNFFKNWRNEEINSCNIFTKLKDVRIPSTFVPVYSNHLYKFLCNFS